MGLPLMGALNTGRVQKFLQLLSYSPGSTKVLFVDLVKRSLAIFSAIEPMIHIVQRPSNGCLH